ncbi:MAG TPA: hypothetical protein VGH98_03085 [Gemmatimonadaceae bacterium]|jgi:DNA-binding response OmpR family regulator
MSLASAATTDHLPAPSPDAIADLTRPDGRVLILGEHLSRLRDLAEGLLRVGCRVEIAALPGSHTGASLGIVDHRLTVVDAIQLRRTSADAVHAARADALTQPIVAVTLADGVRHRLAGAQYVVAHIDEDGDLRNTPQLVRDILSIWSDVRPLLVPGDLRVDRLGRRASVRGRRLALRPFDFRVLRVLAEHFRSGCTIGELCAAASRSPVTEQRAAADVRQALERLRSRFRRSDVVVLSTPDGRYRLTTRVGQPTRRVGRGD